jgi:hypothetical protein
MTDNDMPDLNPDKVRKLIADAWARLSPEDRAERVAYDIEHGIPGVTMHPSVGELEFRRGGRTLAVASLDVLTGEEPLPEGDFISELPDTVPDDLSPDDDA